ncbi:polysaccharide pyruvyl transferase family protein [Oceanobacillus kimchii]|uniref:polysaccharide pyruvyl transferase family protein n=1 Tax=Oceanobacillus kimchii TaxID=746691 RepID=UPI003C7653AC
MKKDNKVMYNLKEKLRVEILSVLPNNSKIHYFDYPVHGNIGDMLIWQGTEKFFEDNNINVLNRFNYHEATRKLKKGLLGINKNEIIVCHGGGNFGDLYSPHQELRNKLINFFPNNKIIILPQTIYYQKEENLINDINLYKSHSDLHIFVRDRRSFNLLKENGLTNVKLIPDMAHILYPVEYNTQNKNNKKELLFLRRDIESNNGQAHNKRNSFDWDDLFSYVSRIYMKNLIRVNKSSVLSTVLSSNLFFLLWKNFMKKTVEKAVIYYSNFNSIKTSRLHGHILACLMNKKNILIDNSYGKNSSYYNEWTKDI